MKTPSCSCRVSIKSESGDAADASGDLDANGLTNLAQYEIGMALNADLDRYDADGDGMSDIFEDYYELGKFTFSDAVDDEDEDGVLNYEEQLLVLSPIDGDTRNVGGPGDLLVLMEAALYPEGGAPTTDANENGVPDWADTALASSATPVFTRVATDDLDGDGMPDLWEHQHGRWKYPSLGLYLRFDDADGDADEDDLTNLQEYGLGTNPVIGDTDDDGINDGDEDDDGDGLGNALELLHGTDPNAWDTDGDGIPDGQEVAEGTDPLDEDSNSRIVGLKVYTRLD